MRPQSSSTSLSNFDSRVFGTDGRHIPPGGPKLLETELYYACFVNAPIGFSVTNPQGQFLEANHAYCSLVGYTETELKSLTFQAITHPADLESTMPRLEALLAGEIAPFTSEKRYVRKDGREVWVQDSISVIREPEGKPLYLLRLSEDITERVKLAEALSKAKESTESILAGVVDVHILFDRQWRYLYVNEACERAMGLKREQILGRTLWEIYPDIIGTELDRQLRRVMNERVATNFDFYYKAKSTWWANRFFPAPEGLAVFATDITERKRAEAKGVAFAALARRLSGARTHLDAAKVIAEAADELFGWDACNLDLYDASRNLVYPMLNVDTIDGQRIDVTPANEAGTPTARGQKVIDSGAQLILRQEPIQFDPDAVPFGDTARPSASLMSAPIQHGPAVIGLLCIQSYTPRAYDAAALEDFAALADHCGEAINRINAEVALRESEERFRQTCDHFEDVIWIADRDIKQVLYINRTYERVFGHACENVYRRLDSFVESVHPDDRESVQHMLQRQRGGDYSPFAYRIIHPEKGIRWIHRRTFPILNDKGEIDRVAGIAQDITERKEAQEKLRESEERYRDLVENSHEFICTHDLNGVILTANRRAADMLGYDPKEFYGKRSFREVLAPEVRHEFDDYLARIQRDGVASGLLKVETSSGERRIWEYHNSLRTEGVDQPIVRGMARDITEQRRAEKALRESEERYRELFENARDAIYVHDLNGRYISVNRAAEQLSGYRREEIIGKHFSNFVAPSHLRFTRENFCRKLDSQLETEYEAEIISKNGRRTPVEVSSRLIYENGVAIGVQGTARDITERRQTQEALRIYSRALIEAQEMERQNIARELHDEIGQVLTAVRINLETIKDSCRTTECLPNIEEGIVIVDDALGRVHELSLNLRPSLLDSLGLSAALRWYLDRYAQRTGMVTEIHGFSRDQRLRQEVETACFRIVQEALTNIARHAKASHVVVQAKRAYGGLLLIVRDDGIGFNHDQVRKDSPTALGLRGMEERARSIGGLIEIMTAPGKGTEIRVLFPLKVADEVEAPNLPPASGFGH